MKDKKDILEKRIDYGAAQSTSFISVNLIDPLPSTPIKQMSATFEEAVTATGFGRFNYILLLAAVPSCWASLFVPTNTAFVLPAAQCDLGLSLIHMGMLNASPFIGMIISAFFWGYLADTFGRKRLLIYGFLADALCNIICAFSTDVWMLAVFKFASGFIIAGPFAIMMSYLSEFHSTKHRSRVIIITGIYIGSVNFILPMLAWIVMPMNKIYILNYVLSPWQIYILICSLPSLIAGLCYTVLPESPKFLIIAGKYKEALAVLKKMYVMNFNKPEDTYPISGLIVNVPLNINKEDLSKNPCKNPKDNNTTTQALKDGWRQIKPLFYRPYLGSACLVLSIQFCTLLGSNTLKLWLPQLFTIVDDYDQVIGSNKGDRASICEIINFSHKTTNVSNIKIETTCTGIVSNDQVYINSGIVGVCTILMYVIVALIINKVSKKTILVLLYVISGGCGLELIWATNPRMMLAMSSVYTAMTGVACVTLISVVVELFPTSLRTMTVSLTMMMGRVGTIIGNVIFPLLLVTGCLPPFLLIGGIILTCLPLLFLLSSPTEEDFK